jgi:hypothetical protein
VPSPEAKNKNSTAKRKPQHDVTAGTTAGRTTATATTTTSDSVALKCTTTNDEKSQEVSKRQKVDKEGPSAIDSPKNALAVDGEHGVSRMDANFQPAHRRPMIR